MTPQTAFVYVRVSTEGQAVDGVSLAAQEQRARAWADANGYEVRGVFIDAGISGKRASNRPQLQRALDAVSEQRGTALVVYSLSRLARSTKDAIGIAERLAKAECDLVSLTERIDTTTAAGKMMFRMLAVLAEFERDLVSERTAAALHHKQTLGERTGEIGYTKRLASDGVHLVDDAADMAIVAEIARLRASGASNAARTWRAIAEELNRRGVTTKKGRVWTLQTVRLVALAHASRQQQTAAA